MQEELEFFFADPCGSNYLRVRRRILRYGRRAFLGQLARLSGLSAHGQHKRVRTEIDRMMPRWALSPRVYQLGAHAAWLLGDTDAARLDRFLWETCLAGILDTGLGTASEPYWITYPSDIADVVARLGLSCQSSALQRGSRGLCDVIETASGRVLWFALGLREDVALARGAVTERRDLVPR